MFKIAGITDEVTTCGCCGKTNLKKTVVFETENGYVYMGTDCAGMVMFGSKKAKNTKNATEEAQAVQYAKNLLKTYPADKVLAAVWNRYGFSGQIRNGKMQICNFAEIEL